MSENILGIDLGTNSIGWAIRNTDESKNQIIDKGVLTFDKGVAEDKSGEHPMVQKRTEARGKRRNYQAEKYRKWELLKTLIENNMCPLTMDELDEWKHYKKGIGRKYPMKKEWIEWLRFDFDSDQKPDFSILGLDKHASYYAFRAFIVDESKKEIFQRNPHIIGRVLYQIVQRRGYNDIGDIDENEKNELSKTIMKGGGVSGAIGANSIEPYIKNHGTLGAALYYIQKNEKVRIRKRYNLRSEYEREIKEICRVQNLEHLYKKLWTAIIWQRPLRSQKGLVGICTFEKNKSRCPISHPLYEEYRTWVFINNLGIKPIYTEKDHMPLDEILHKHVYPEFYKATDFKLNVIKKKLEKLNYKITAKFPDDTKVPSASFLYRIKDLFGDNWIESTGWNDIIRNKCKTKKYDLEDLWHIHFAKSANKNTGESSYDFIKRFGIEKLKLNLQEAEKFAKIKLNRGYATLSIHAIKKILPFLQKGFMYSEAIYLANLSKVIDKPLSQEIIDHFSEEIRRIITKNKDEKKYVQAVNELINDQLNSEHRFGMDETYQLDQDDFIDIENKLVGVIGEVSWNEMEEKEQKKAFEFVSSKYLNFLQKRIYSKNVFEKVDRLHDSIFNWISETYSVPKERIKFLWHPSEQETYAKALEINGTNFLGSPEPINRGFKNPMALKTMHKLKRLINYLLEIGKIDEDTRVVIEIARELNDANKRKAIERWQRNRETQNNLYKKQIEDINQECGTSFNPEDKSNINKIRLWEEQKRLCIYTGKTIRLCDVLSGSKYDFEHTIPASMSFDNELKNITIADKTYNQQIKGKKLPSQCPNFEMEYQGYRPIMDTLQSIFGRYVQEEKKSKYGKKIISYKFEKIIELEKTYQEWKDKHSDDKEIKDNIIIKKHYLKMELDYWRYKLNTFILKEYKSGWRNSQLRDTQTITKYALPYLKTVFKKVEVQKGNITADFRKIYKVQARLEKKDRTKHSHHAIDAAVLTLIPPPALRDKILQKYNEANENNLPYHERPKNWDSYEPHFIFNLEDNILINYLPENRTLTPTKKNIRKRGELQYVKETLPNGKRRFKLNERGKKIPLFANGDSIRGQLHKESFFGAINNGEQIILVERYPISSFTSIKDCKHIIDNKVRELVESELQKRIRSGMSFDKAKLEPVPFHKGNEVIKKVRCRVLAGAGYLRYEKSIKINEHSFKSKHYYKQHIYAQNDQNTYCLYYEKKIDDKTLRAFRIVGLFEVAQAQLCDEIDFFKEKHYNSIIIGKGKKITEIPLVHIIKNGTKCIFYKTDLEELKDEKLNYNNRLFVVYKFNTETNTNFLFLKNHIEARTDKDIKEKEYRNLDLEKYQSRLQITADKFTCAIENLHFIINIDGTISWKI